MKTKIIKLKSQQGDVILRKLKSMPDGERKTLAIKRCILAHGESGNIHVIEQEDAELIAIGDRMLLTITESGEVQHGEHGAHKLSPGIWEVGRVQEFDHLKKMARPVID